MSLERFIKEMPKVELHVHLEGATQPETLLTLADRNQVNLPGTTIDELRKWYQFTDFSHFIEVYLTSSRCICTPDDIEFIAREFLKGQAAQNIVYSEVTFTAYTHYQNYQISFKDQLAAINRAQEWAKSQLGISMGLVIDISRQVTSEEGLLIADWAIEGIDKGVIALGLGGPEQGHPPEKFKEAFERAHEAGLASVPHAGEVVGPESIWGALNTLYPIRIGHGVRCLEDSALVDYLRSHQVPLEICPTSNICLNVFPDIKNHPLPRLLSEGLYVTINSDDPPMFETTLTNEYITIVKTFGFEIETIEQLLLNAVRASLLDKTTKQNMENQFTKKFSELRSKHEIS